MATQTAHITDRKRTVLVFKFAVRGLLWGVVSGASLGALFPCVLLQNPLALLHYGPLGAFLGVVVGVPVGLLNGVVMGIIALLFFSPLKDAKNYRTRMYESAVLVTLFGSGIGFVLLDGASYLVIPATIIATLAAAYISQRVAAWYIASEGRI
jgi:hypothetical protein